MVDRGNSPPQQWCRGVHRHGSSQVGRERGWIHKVACQVVHEQARRLTVDRRHLDQHILMIDVRACLHVHEVVSFNPWYLQTVRRVDAALVDPD